MRVELFILQHYFHWSTLKNRLKKEGSEVITDCDQLKWIFLGCPTRMVAGKGFEPPTRGL